VFTVTGDLVVNSTFTNSQQARLAVSGGNLTGIPLWTTLDSWDHGLRRADVERKYDPKRAGAFIENLGTLTATAGLTNSSARYCLRRAS